MASWGGLAKVTAMAQARMVAVALGKMPAMAQAKRAVAALGRNWFTASFFPACFWTVVHPLETLQPCSLRGDKIADLDFAHSSSGLLQWHSQFPSFALCPSPTCLFLSLLSCFITSSDDFLQAFKIQIFNTRALQGNSHSFFW